MRPTETEANGDAGATTIVDILKLMRSFIAVAELGSFSRAARLSNVSAAAMTRDVAALESHLGVKLLQRTTRHVRTTPEGVVYFGHAKQIVASIQDAENSLRGTHGGLTGSVSVTAPNTFGRLYVTPELLTFASRHPGIVLRTIYADSIVDMMEEQVDVAVRIAHLPDSGATAIRVGHVRRRLCASPGYLEQYGVPRSGEDLSAHFAITTTNHPLPWRIPNGTRVATANPKARLVANTVDLAIAAAEAGLGIVWLLSYQVESSVQAGRLRPILLDYTTPDLPVHVVHLLGKGAPRRTRALVDFLAKQLRKRLSHP